LKALDLKNIFLKELYPIYDKAEAESLFYLSLEYLLDIPRIQLNLNPEFTILKPELDRFFEVLEKLKLHKPIQYIFGETEFFGLKFKVNQNVLIPRQETEELIALILQNSYSKTNEPIQILDIGTGSGIIAISLAKELPNAKVYALDVSQNALQVAKQNAKSNNVDINWIHADILEKENWNLVFKNLKFNIIVSNPPYVRQLEKTEIHPNVLDNEPHLALFVDDNNPLLFYKAITDFAVDKLKPNGQLFFEINEYLGNETKQVLVGSDFEAIQLLKDLNGKDRMLKGTLK